MRPATSDSPVRNKATKLFAIFLVIAGLVYVTLYYKLGYENMNVDQFLWYARTQRFFSAIAEGRFQSTYQQYHPGVLLMYLIGLGQLSYKLFTGDPSIYPDISYLNFGAYNFHTKLYVVTFCLIILLISAVTLRKLTSSWFFSCLFLLALLVETYYTGVLRNLHMDGLVSVLIFATTITFYAALKYKSWKYLILSGVLMGLGLLTKSTSIFAGIYCLLITTGYLIASRKHAKWFIKTGLVWLILAGLVFFALFPAMWVDSVSVVKRIVVEGIFETGADGGFSHYVNNIRKRDPGPSFYPLVFKYRVTPLAQLATLTYITCLMYSAFRFIQNRSAKDLRNIKISLSSVSFVCVLIYVIVLMLASKKTDRYFSPVYPFLTLISVQIILTIYKLSVKKVWGRAALLLVLTIGISYDIVNLVTLNPYGMAYYNHAWGGIRKAKKEIYLNQGGIGYFEIAEFINNQDLPLDTVIGATSDTPLRYICKFRTSQPQPENRKLYKLVVLPLQQDDQFRHGRKLALRFDIQGQEYWRVYYRDFEPKMLTN